MTGEMSVGRPARQTTRVTPGPGAGQLSKHARGLGDVTSVTRLQ